jgi:outer membrane protein assembly factor BamB
LPEPSYPVVVNGVVYVTTQSDPVVYAIDLGTGQILWHKWLGAGALAPAYDGGQLYVGNTNGQVWAFNPSNGAIIWTQSLDSSGNSAGTFQSPPTAYGGQVYLSSSSATYALNETTGATVWIASGGGPTPAVDSAGVYDNPGCSQEYNPSNGLVIWTAASRDCFNFTASALGDGKVIASDYTILEASNGYELGTIQYETGPGTPAVTGGVLYTSTYNSGLEAIGDDGVGSVLWTFSPASGYLATPPVVAGNVVYVGSSSGEVYALDAATGAQIWSQAVDDTLSWSTGPDPSGLAVADQALVVPSDNALTVFSDSSSSVESTTSTLSSDPSSPDYGQQITVTDTVAGSDGGGHVDFESNGASLSGCAAVPLTASSGGYTATCAIGAPPVGSEKVIAYYSADAGYTSAVADLDVPVATDPTTTTLTAPASSALPGSAVTFTATVAGSDGGGTVSFSDNYFQIAGCGSVPLSSGPNGETAVCTTTSLQAGSNQVTADYAGDTVASTSSASTSVMVELPPGSDYTWTGADRYSDYWLYGANWSQDISPSGTVGTLAFSSCPYGVCYSYDSTAGIAATGLVIDSSGSYQISGDESLSLGSGGLTVEGEGSNGTNPSTLDLPLTLGAPQTWTIDEADTPLDQAVAGDEPLTVDFSNSSSVVPSGGFEVGDLTATGDGALYLNGNMTVNSTDSNPTELDSGGGIEADQSNNSVGPVTVGSGGWLSVGGVANGGSSLGVDGNLTFMGGSELDLSVASPGTAAGTDYSQLTATGNVDLSGANLYVSQGADDQDYCDNLTPGDTLTLLRSSGSITGGFANYPNGATVDIANNCDTSTQDATGTINYSPSAVTLTITNGGNAGGSGGAGGTGPNPPVEVNPPSLSGAAQEGETLQVDPGTWEQATSFEYSWWACDTGGNCTQIPNASSSTFLLTSAQLGDQVGAIVVADGPGGSNSDYTNLSDPVMAEPVPTISSLPAITGAISPGDPLSASSGSWSNAPTAYSYQWQRCSSTGTSCTPISGATSQTYTLTSTDSGSTLEVQVTASNYGGKSSPANSRATGVVAAEPTVSSAPSITPAAVRGALQSVLTPVGKTASLAAVILHQGYTFSFHAPAAGRLAVTWTTTVKHKTTLVARGGATPASPQAIKVRVRLTAAGSAVLKRASHLKIKSVVSFTPDGLQEILASRTFTLPGHRSTKKRHALRPAPQITTLRRIAGSLDPRHGRPRQPALVHRSDFRKS